MNYVTQNYIDIVQYLVFTIGWLDFFCSAKVSWLWIAHVA